MDLTTGAIVLFLVKGDALIGMYLNGEGTAEAVEVTRGYGMQYLHIMLLGLPAFMLVLPSCSTVYLSGGGRTSRSPLR